MLILHAWGLIAAAFALVVFFPNPLTFLLAIMVVGARQLGLTILMHDAAHGALHPNRKINDFLGNWLCGVPLGVGLEQYRSYHLAHHKYVQQPEDPDLVLAAPFPTSKDSMRRKIIRDLTGQTFYRQRIAGLMSIKAAGVEEQSGAAKQAEVLSGKKAFRHHILFNLSLFALLILLGVWWIFPFVWIAAMATWFQLATRLRNIAEHACVKNSEDPLAHARTTHANLFERLLIAPYWVNFHSEHHAFMHLPCYKLPLAHKMLVERGHGDRIPQASSYRDILRKTTAAAAA